MSNSIMSFGVTFASVQSTKDAITNVGMLYDAIGLVKTSDTGQIVVDDIVGIPALGTVVGYEVRTWTDEVGPLYLKLVYHVGTSAGNITYRITIGTGTDGAGNITGVMWSSIDVNGNIGTSTPADNYASRVGAMVSVAIHMSTGYYAWWSFDRQRDGETGSIVANPGSMLMYSTTNQASSILFFKVSPVWNKTHAFNSGKPNAHPTGTGTYTTGLGLSQYKQDIVTTLGWYPEGLCIHPGVITFFNIEIPTAGKQEFYVTLYGQTRKYKCINSSGLWSYNTNSNIGAAMVWE